MSDNSTTQSNPSSNIRPVKITEELKTSFINYAMSVIVDRALPDVRDGLKPVHRRSLFAMYGLKNFINTPTKKSARIVGDVIGKYHPHGDTAVYETLVRMAQPFSMRYPLVDGQGNFGNIDGDKAAAMRYTEIRMSKIANEMIADLEKETVDTTPNYDNTEQIPVVMPNKFPNLLVNGTSGIAVGMATSIPPHNLTEVTDATLALIDNPDIDLDGLMQYIKAPDFPTGGIIYGTSGIREAYATGNGRAVIRAKTHIEGEEDGKQSIVIDEIPYTISKKRLVERISECVRDKIIEGITEIYDYSGKDHDVRVVINLRRGESPEIVLNKLFKHTQMQISFGINMLALVDNHPEVLTLKQILQAFVKHRREIVTRRTVYDLRKCRDRAHKLEGFAVALKNIDEIIHIIRNSSNRVEAKLHLMEHGWDYGMLDSFIERATDGSELCKPDTIAEKFGCHDGKYFLSDPQCEAILDMQLHRLTGLEYDKIVSEYQDLVAQIKDLLRILDSETRLLEVIREELVYIRNTYGDQRRSVLVAESSEITKADLIEAESAVITLSHAGYIKYQPLAEYEAQARGGRGRRAAKMKDEDVIDSMYVVNTHDTILCFTSLGKVFSLKVYDLPLATSNTKGRPIVNLLRLEENEAVQAILPVNEFDKHRYLFFATERGLVKKTKLFAYRNVNVNGLKAIRLIEGDKLVNVALTTGNDTIALFSSAGFASFFNEYYPGYDDDGDDSVEEVAEVSDEEVASEEVDVENSDAETTDSDNEDVVVTSSANRGVKPCGRVAAGVRGIKLTPNAKLVSMIVIDPEIKDVLIACENGFGKRTYVEEFPLRSRNCKGVIAIKTSERNGNVIGAIQVAEDDQVIMINDGGVLIRTYIKQISRTGRNAQGVKLIRLDDNVKLVSMERVIGEDDEELVSEVDKVEGDVSENIEGVVDNTPDIESMDADVPETSNEEPSSEEPSKEE
jgi:DNA gyrase subunit A